MGRIRVHLLTAGLLAAGLALYGGLVHRLPTTTVPLRLPWPLVAAGFAATTVFAVHLEFRRHAHSFLLSELPLVLGLYLLSPPELVLARLAGSAAVLVLHRRQAATKLAFNLALFLFETCLAASVFALLRGDQPLGPRGWAAALLATLTVDLAGALVVVTAVSLYERAWQWRIWPEVAGAGALAAVANTSLALVAVLTLAADPRAGALLLVVAAVLLLAYRGYGSLRQRHHHLERLYDFTRTVSSSPEGDRTVRALLEQAASLLRAETAELLLHEQGRGTARLVRLAGDGGVVDLGPPSPPGPLFEVPGGATAIHPRPIADRRVRAEAERRGLRDAVVAALPGADRPLGALLVGNRLGDVSTFDEEDAKLLEALANQASVALEKAWLIDRLRVEAVERTLQAAHDALTGLGNRRWFLEELAGAIAARPPAGFAVLLLDLDRFKEVNDTLGHHTGDLVLREVGMRLERSLPDSDTIARLGGDEFAVLVPAVPDREAARAVGRMVRAALEQPLATAGLELRVAGSVGIALCPEHGADPGLLLQRADVAMYHAKEAHSGIEVYAAERDQYSPRRLALFGELRVAIERGALQVVYQPKAELPAGRVVGFEALLRWRDPTHGLVPPDEFVPIAEATGLITPMTRHVLQAAVEQVGAWRDQGAMVGMSVNLSVRNLLEPGLVDRVDRLLAGAGVPPGLLTIEITEGAVMTDPDATIAVLHQLSGAGVHLAIDDFGTGYSSLAYLKQLPVDEVKLDKAFVMGMTVDPDDEAIVASTIELAHNLGLRIVAEGVEDRATWEALAALGCELAQGHYVAPPMPAEQATGWLWERRAGEPTAERPERFTISATHRR